MAARESVPTYEGMRAGASGGTWGAALFALALLGFGCGATTGLEEADAGALRCNPDEVEACACPGGGIGTQSCGPDRVFGACDCGDAGHSAGDASLIEDASARDGDAAPPIGGGPGSGQVVACGVMNPTTCSLGAGERCCILEPGIDHCFGPGEDCACTGPNCRATVASCDGPEDCEGEKVCCGSFADGGYTSIGCKESCSREDEREICHPGGQACSRSGASCTPSPSLPTGYYRCE